MAWGHGAGEAGAAVPAIYADGAWEDGRDALDEILRLTGDGVCEAMGRRFRFGSHPLEEASEAIPHGLRTDLHRDFTSLDYESVLGAYDPDARRAVVYLAGVRHVAGLLGVPELAVERIAFVHERAHALHDLGHVDPNALPDAAAAASLARRAAFAACAVELREQLAQVATLATFLSGRERAGTDAGHALMDVALRAFLDLMPRQSRRYRLPGWMAEVAPDRLAGKLRLVLDIADGGAALTPAQVHSIVA